VKDLHCCKRGVVVGCNDNLEWLIPWWWENYQRHCSLPVAFIDFGMSDKMRSYCSQRGELIKIDILPNEKLEVFDEKITALPEHSKYKEYTTLRKGWFHKPQAMAATPFDVSLWLDLDCEVLADLSPIFDYAKDEPFIGLVEDVCVDPVLPYTFYNGGVVLYPKGSLILERLVQAVHDGVENFFGDDNLLSYLLHKDQYPVVEMPYIFNWRLTQGIDPRVVIFHWVGDAGKNCIKAFGGVAKALKMEG
jgi:hypothetical protein